MCKHPLTEEVPLTEPLPEPTPGTACYRRCAICWRPVRYVWVACSRCGRHCWTQDHRMTLAEHCAASTCDQCLDAERRDRIRQDVLRDQLLVAAVDFASRGGNRGRA